MITKNQTKKRTSLTRLFLCLTALIMLWTTGAQAQVSYSNNFNANATGWTGDISRTTATTACGTASMRKNLYSSATTGNMVTPAMSGNNAGLVTVSYMYKAANWSANTVGTNPWGYFYVQYSTTSAAGPWTTAATVSQETQNGSCISKSHTFTPPSGTNLWIKWDCYRTAGDYYINFDDVTVSQGLPPSCLSPSSPVGTPTTSTTANISWTAPLTPPSNGYEYAVTTSATPPGSGTPESGTSTSVSGLSPATTYYLHVRSYCGGSDYSTWATSAAFTTPCNTVTSFPFNETFETASPSINCWSNILVAGAANWTYATGSSGGSVTTAHGGTRNARFVSMSPSGGNTPITKLVSPVLDLSAFSGADLSFWYAQEVWAGDQNTMTVYYRISSSDPWVSLATYTSSVAAWTQVTLSLPGVTSTYQIAFEGHNNYGRANVVDDVTITGLANCSGTPTPGTASASVNPVCQNNATNLVLTGFPLDAGITYQWQTSTTPGGPYTDISGATTTTYVYSPATSGTEYIVCKVSCSFSGMDALSNEVSLGVNASPSATATGPATLVTYQNGTFSVTGYPVGTTFQWQSSTASCATGFSNIPAATADNVLLNSNAGGTFYIRCMLTNAGCSAPSNCITLVVTVAGDNVCSANTLNVGVNGPFTNVGGTVETGEVAPPTTSCTGQSSWCSITPVLNNTVWFTFTPPASGQYSFRLDPSRTLWDTQFALWNASSCSPFGGFTMIAANDDSLNSPFNSYIAPVCLNAGQTYYFQFDGYSGTNNNWGILVTQVNTVTAGISGSQTGCSAVNLTATGGSTYLWSGGLTPNTDANTFTASGPYTVTVTSAQGCTSQATANVVINVPSTDPGSATSNAPFDNICAGGNVTLSVGGGTLGTGAQWQWYSGSCGGTPVGSGSSITVSPSVTTNYFVRAEGVCGNTMCVFITITVNTGIPAQAVTIPIVGLPAYACNATAATLSIPAVANATFYTWDGPTGTTFDGFPSPYSSLAPTVNVVFGNPNGSGYRIGVQAGNACGSSARKSEWLRGIVSTPAAVSGVTTTCASTSGTYTTGPVDGATSYLWTITGDASVIGTGTSVTVNFGPAWAGGTLCVRAQTPCYTSPSKCLVIGTSASPLNTISGPLSACPNDVLTFSVPASSGAASYAWTVPANSSISGGAGTNSIQVTFAPNYNNLGNICVNVTSICGVTSATKCRTVAPGVPSVPASITGATNGLCGQSISYSTPFSPGTTYNWTAPGTITGNGNNAVSIAYGSFTTGQVCVTASTGCGTSAARCVAIKGAPNSPIAITTSPASWCANTSGVEFNANVSNTAGSYTLSWTYPSMPVANYVSGGGNTGQLILDWGTGNGNITVTATNSCGAGSKAYVATIGCREGQLATANSLNVYPNPTAGVLNVEYTAEKGTAQVTVLDLSGRVVMTQTHANAAGQNTLQLDLSKVAKGAYMLNVQTNGSNNQVRVVVE